MKKSIKLKESQEIAAQMIACGITGKEVALRLELREETVSRWNKLPEFRRRVNDNASVIGYSVQNEFRSLAICALKLYREVLTDPSSDLKLRLNVASKILDSARFNSDVFEESKQRDLDVSFNDFVRHCINTKMRKLDDLSSDEAVKKTHNFQDHIGGDISFVCTQASNADTGGFEND